MFFFASHVFVKTYWNWS